MPDDIVIGSSPSASTSPTASKGFILDGFPRTLAQAAALDKMLADKKTQARCRDRAQGRRQPLVERIVGRFTCAKCGEGYHDRFKRPKVRGMCDVCGSTEFTRRADDNAETVTKRLMAYYRETSPLIGYYFCKGNLRTVDGMGPIERGRRGRSTRSWRRIK